MIALMLNTVAALIASVWFGSNEPYFDRWIKACFVVAVAIAIIGSVTVRLHGEPYYLPPLERFACCDAQEDQHD
jgi:hypothetical protein